MDGASSKGGVPFLIVYYVYIRLIRGGLTVCFFVCLRGGDREVFGGTDKKSWKCGDYEELFRIFATK